ncbi:MAG: rhodanese-like domain-containing protein [Bacteroidota bacterium]|jgi:rhodanese-related sulfurtransferase
MRQSLLEALLLIVAAIVLGVAYTFVTKQGFFVKTQSVHSAATSNMEMISLATAKELFESNNALFIDARHEFDYQAGHIRGAVNVALKKFDTHLTWLNRISKDKLLVVYCDGAECNSSIELAVKLMESGFTNVKVFFGGWQEWNSAKLPIEK